MSLAQNKFLVGLGAVVLVGAGALGYLTFDAAGKFTTIRGSFTEESAKYKALQSLDLYPNAENLKQLEDSGLVVDAAVVALQKKLAGLNIPLEPISPEQFQDRLRATVSSVSDKATSAGIQLPENFYLGFNRYQSSPPKSEMAAPLWRQLKAIELSVNTLIDSKINSITEIRRTALPGEDGAVVASAAVPARKGPVAKGPAAKGPAAKKPDSAKQLVFNFPFEIDFVADQANFRRAINGLASNKTQFFIVQPLSIANQNGKPLSKVDSQGNAAGATVITGTAGAAGAVEEGAVRTRDQYIVGTEKLNVALRLQMVIFGADQPKS